MAIDKRKMVITCRHLPDVVSVSLVKSAKHTTGNPQSTNVPVKCTVCKQFFWSYHFKQHWEKHHKRTGNIPPLIETSLAVSQDEIEYFKRGQKAKPRLRKRASGGGGGSSAKKIKGKGKGKGWGKA